LVAPTGANHETFRAVSSFFRDEPFTPLLPDPRPESIRNFGMLLLRVEDQFEKLITDVTANNVTLRRQDGHVARCAKQGPPIGVTETGHTQTASALRRLVDVYTARFRRRCTYLRQAREHDCMPTMAETRAADWSSAARRQATLLVMIARCFAGMFAAGTSRPA